MRAGLEGSAGDLVGVSVTVQQRVLSFAWVYMVWSLCKTIFPSCTTAVEYHARRHVLQIADEGLEFHLVYDIYQNVSN